MSDDSLLIIEDGKELNNTVLKQWSQYSIKLLMKCRQTELSLNNVTVSKQCKQCNVTVLKMKQFQREKHNNHNVWTGFVHCHIHVGVPSGAGTDDGMPIWHFFIVARDLSEHFLSHFLSRLCRTFTAGGVTKMFFGRCTLWPSGSSTLDPSMLSLFSGNIAYRTSEDLISFFSLAVHVDDP